jgi:asparagine synthase (glutamine-hydrolysing)
MCGVCGVAIPRNAGRRPDANQLARMRDSLTHRGPDDAGLYVDSQAGLGHRRLSIVDLNGGHQPMPNENRTIWISYNGEIYNHKDLRPMLKRSGHVYRTASDTETIVHLYEEHGAGAAEYLRGMFAFAIWDSERRRLLLCRDRLGIKPLYYALTGDGTIYFASEIKAILESGAIKPELNHDSLADYAANRSTTGADTLFRGIKRLPPGHTLTWQDGQIEIAEYWKASFAEPDPVLSNDEYVDRFNELFRESISLRMMADVPLGMFLSGGIDSSAIAAVMSRLVEAPIKTFSVAFEEKEANELAYARAVSRAFGTEHYEITVTPNQFFDSLPGLVYHEDEPIAHPSSIPLYFVSKLASQHVKVVLTGEGSDELLAGYDKYRKTVYNLALGRAYTSSVPGGARRAIERAIEKLTNTSRLKQKLARTFLYVKPEIQDIYFDNFSVFSRSMQQDLFTPGTRELMNQRDPYSRILENINASDAGTLLDRLLAGDMQTYLQELLMKQDQMSMAASIESRVPFLDHKLVEFAAGLPSRMKLRGLTTKYILRKAMAGVLPEEILTRRKMGFPVPIGAWLRGQFSTLVDEYVTGSRARDRNIFNHQYVSELAARHAAGENHSERLWSLINFEIWQRRFFDKEKGHSENQFNDVARVGYGTDRWNTRIQVA